MRLSPDAILFGLGLLKEGVVLPFELAGHLRAAAESGAPDQLVAVEEALLEHHPALAGRVAWLGAQPPYALADCTGCRARFRVPREQVGPAAYCPLCGEAIMTARNLLFLGDWAVGGLRAAEAEAPAYVVPARRRFAHFDLAGLLGRGGAGKVYEARNRRSGRTVALKMLDFRPLDSVAETFKRLERESHVAAAVVHEHVVRIFDLGVAEGVPFIEMELIRGESLSDRVRKRGPMQAHGACRTCLETLWGLAAVHQEKIVHGDIKPGNILIDERGRARLTDFGISRFLEETTSLSATGILVGSPHFMAPEKWRGGTLGVRTDLYAMGLVLYYAVTGRLPYEGESRVTLMYKHLHEPLLQPGQPHLLLPDYLVEVIRRATEKAPQDRFGSAEEFADALSGFLDGTVGRC